jgi:hypothetical protein
MISTQQKKLLVLATMVATLLVACGGGSSTPGPPPVVSPPPAIPEQRVNLADYVSNSLSYVQQFSEGYAVPASAELTRFDSLLTDLLNQQLESVRTAATDINFELVKIIDTGTDDNEMYCLRELALSGQGFYCVDFGSANTHHISAPHPLYDRNTNSESIAVMRGTGARFLSIATTH